MTHQDERARVRTPERRLGTLGKGSMPPPATDIEELLARALVHGDEHAFAHVLERLYPSMMRIAHSHVRTRAEAEEVVQETWLAALRGISRFEHRSSFRTWLYRILRNRARTHGRRAARMITFTDLEPTLAPAHGPPADVMWRGAPDVFGAPQERALLARELTGRIAAAIADLPERQRQVVTLRDVDGLTSGEVARDLGVSDGNQRVLLHRARTTLRRSLAGYLDEGPGLLRRVG